MQGSRQSSLAFLSPRSATSLWTSHLVATLWKLAIMRSRKVRSQSKASTNHPDIIYGSPTTKGTIVVSESSNMHKATRKELASGIVSLADLEAITGFRLVKNDLRLPLDDDACSDAPTATSDNCSDGGENLMEDDKHVASSINKSSAHSPLNRHFCGKSAKWVCVGYGRYVKISTKV
ncbi:uncharacterized protein PHALS_03537 [Plasmopara halstedii]|uniref:Uncharacterized protein n=1 Tax=Plasmopara halstedii TaxID=4781 RepID=A0A0P1AYV5_PLAHL|nr:uncharacterized protein PHALS_03537 [Plasmopara halstedii]CEG46862.1 hypothetical protein PHALS_03537 [Plasmopara halstedii]|eukprot:XP_024583231.1 hypothetical protein PHALS_03537 [Plasmopara halstedii]